jgi:D-arabinose 5-phosphate isomerase GutQ
MVQEPIDNLPMTPPDPVLPDDLASKPDSKAIKLALHVISTERAALAHLERLYASDAAARDSLAASVTTLASTIQSHGKVVIAGVGKSGKIGQKLVATFNSLGIHCCFLHPTEALHGDLGVIKPNDTVLMITFSGRTPELLLLLPHIPTHNPLIVMTSHVVASTCPLLHNRINSILLPAPIHESEQVSFGLSAPTTSTTVALAIGDGLALAVAERLHTSPGGSPAEVFMRHHPGGAIGAAAMPTVPVVLVPKISDLAIQVADVPIATPTSATPGSPLRALDVLLTAVRSPGGWVRVSPQHIMAPRRIQRLNNPTLSLTEAEAQASLHAEFAPLVIEKPDWISVLGSCTVAECAAWILQMRSEERGRGFLKKGTVLGVVDVASREVTGVIEIEEVVGETLDGLGN